MCIRLALLIFDLQLQSIGSPCKQQFVSAKTCESKWGLDFVHSRDSLTVKMGLKLTQLIDVVQSY